MRNRSSVLLLVVLFAAVAVCWAADDSFMGTWKLNEAKSKLAPDTGKNQTVVYAAAGDSVKVTADGVDLAGKPIRHEWTGKFDGKEYPVTGDATADSRSYKRINATTLELTNKKDGKAVASGRIVISADGKTRTVTIKSKNSAGKEVTSVSVYDKQ